MGWDFKWFSSYDTDFNFDYHVSFTQEELGKNEAFYNYSAQASPSPEREGVSVFFKDSRGRVFHTHSAFARGIDMLNVAYPYLDLVPRAGTRSVTTSLNSGSDAMMNMARHFIADSNQGTISRSQYRHERNGVDFSSITCNIIGMLIVYLLGVQLISCPCQNHLSQSIL